MIAHQEKITASQLKKVVEVSNKLKINPSWLMMAINKETGGTFSPSIKNRTSSASGLIQFMEATANSLGTTTAKLRAMSFNQQMDYVYLYFKPYSGKLKSFYDVYLAIFFPVAIGKPDSWNFPNWVRNANKGLDTNKDGVINLGEWKKWAIKGQSKFLDIDSDTIKNSFMSLFVIALLGAGVYLFTTK
jgi:hypothetical protein